MSESQRRGKNENKKAKKWFMPTEQRWREGFFIIGLFLRVPDSLAERRRQGDRGVLSLSNTHTDTHRPQRQLKLWRSPGRHQESLGPR